MKATPYMMPMKHSVPIVTTSQKTRYQSSFKHIRTSSRVFFCSPGRYNRGLVTEPGRTSRAASHLVSLPIYPITWYQFLQRNHPTADVLLLPMVISSRVESAYPSLVPRVIPRWRAGSLDGSYSDANGGFDGWLDGWMDGY